MSSLFLDLHNLMIISVSYRCNKKETRFQNLPEFGGGGGNPPTGEKHPEQNTRLDVPGDYMCPRRLKAKTQILGHVENEDMENSMK